MSLPILSKGHSHTLARLFATMSRRTLNSGDTLFKTGDVAENLVYVVNGQVELRNGDTRLDCIEKGFAGEETAVELNFYTSTAIAVTAVEILLFPREALQEFLASESRLRSHFYQSLLAHFNHFSNVSLLAGKTSVVSTVLENKIHFIGWLLAIIVPAAVYFLSSEFSTLSWSSINFLSIFSAAVVMWVFRLVAEYIPAIFTVMAVLVLGLVPSDVILAGYASGSFFMALSVFAIGGVLVHSGLTYRLALTLLNWIPQRSFLYQITVFTLGFLLTPLLPSANGRAALLGPLSVDMSNIVGFKPGQRAATGMAISSFIGLSLFSACFLTAKSINFAVFGMLPTQVKDQFSWGYWVFASSIAILVMLLCFLFLMFIFFRKQESVKFSEDNLQTQLKILGKISGLEWYTLLGAGLFIVGVMTEETHKISPPWIGLAVLFVLLTLGGISKNNLQKDVDWSFLLMLGGFVGLAKAMNHLGIDQWLSSQLVWLGNFMRSDFYLFVLLLGIIIYFMRLIVPNNAAIILLCSLFIPVAITNGINPWVIGFIVLTFSDGWFMPYQCSYYLQYEELQEKKSFYNSRAMIHFNLWSNLFRFAAIYSSIPFWHSLGFL